jgi:2'-5' RNA ligase
MGTGSGYLDRYLENPEQYVDEVYKASRIRKFYSPFILGNFAPHFTLLSSYKGANRRPELVQKFERIFSEFTEFTVNSICLLVQYRTDENWVIYKEFER